jgi:hypothetical protein
MHLHKCTIIHRHGGDCKCRCGHKWSNTRQGMLAHRCKAKSDRPTRMKKWKIGTRPRLKLSITSMQTGAVTK